MVGLTILRKDTTKKVQKKVCGEKANVNENVDWEEKLLSQTVEYSLFNIFTTQMKEGCFLTYNLTKHFVIEMKNTLMEKQK